MRLTDLTIFNYKNISEAELHFSPKLNCFIGGNGQGKTNVLDAIHFLSFCRSYSSSIDALSVRHGQEFMSLQGLYEHEDGSKEDIHVGLKVGQKKVVRRGKKAYRRISEHIGLIPLVMVSPSDQILVSGGSDERRRFIDMVICQYDAAYTEALLRYNRALQQRNVMLKQDEEPDEALMSILEEQMAQEGETVFAAREKFVGQLVPLFQQIYQSSVITLHQNVSVVNARILEAQTMPVITVLIAAASNIEHGVIVQFKEFLKSVGVIVMSMRKHGIVYIVKVKPHLIRIDCKQRRKSGIEQNRLSVIFYIERQAPLPLKAAAVSIVYKHIYLHYYPFPLS